MAGIPSDAARPWSSSAASLDLYIWDYCTRRGYHGAAHALRQDAGLQHQPEILLQSPQGLLYEYWGLFWDLFSSAHNGAGNPASLADNPLSSERASRTHHQTPRQDQALQDDAQSSVEGASGSDPTEILRAIGPGSASVAQHSVLSRTGLLPNTPSVDPQSGVQPPSQAQSHPPSQPQPQLQPQFPPQPQLQPQPQSLPQTLPQSLPQPQPQPQPQLQLQPQPQSNTHTGTMPPWIAALHPAAHLPGCVRPFTDDIPPMSSPFGSGLPVPAPVCPTSTSLVTPPSPYIYLPPTQPGAHASLPVRPGPAGFGAPSVPSPIPSQADTNKLQTSATVRILENMTYPELTLWLQKLPISQQTAILHECGRVKGLNPAQVQRLTPDGCIKLITSCGNLTLAQILCALGSATDDNFGLPGLPNLNSSNVPASPSAKQRSEQMYTELRALGQAEPHARMKADALAKAEQGIHAQQAGAKDLSQAQTQAWAQYAAHMSALQRGVPLGPPPIIANSVTPSSTSTEAGTLQMKDPSTPQPGYNMDNLADFSRHAEMFAQTQRLQVQLQSELDQAQLTTSDKVNPQLQGVTSQLVQQPRTQQDQQLVKDDAPPGSKQQAKQPLGEGMKGADKAARSKNNPSDAIRATLGISNEATGLEKQAETSLSQNSKRRKAPTQRKRKAPAQPPSARKAKLPKSATNQLKESMPSDPAPGNGPAQQATAHGKQEEDAPQA